MTNSSITLKMNVNIRDKANGKIIGKILKSDMIDNKALLLSANGGGIDDLNYENFEKKWYEVFYLPPDVEDGENAIHGFVYGSQVKLKIKDFMSDSN